MRAFSQLSQCRANRQPFAKTGPRHRRFGSGQAAISAAAIPSYQVALAEALAKRGLSFVLGLKTAKARGVEVPQALLVRADRVIE